jgi:hypothetical protein
MTTTKGINKIGDYISVSDDNMDKGRRKELNLSTEFTHSLGKRRNLYNFQKISGIRVVMSFVLFSWV